MKLIYPEKILEQHLVTLGKTGAGKSSALRHAVEYLLDHKKRVCILDPKGDWWGLKFSADGKGKGYPVIAFGDFKESKASDVPINERSGSHLAELIAGGNRPAMIGLGGWKQAQMTRFFIDFASAIFAKNHGELYLVIDECHNFAPKAKIMSPQAGECLHWCNRLLSEGRGLGIVCLLASQRPQKVHNDTLTSCETLVAMRVIHKSDRNAVKDWIEGCGDVDRGNEVLGALAGMQRGDAYVWSPEISFGPERIKFPMFTTFDSFAPPQLQKKVSSASWETVDLDQVRQKLSAVIEEAKANDPQELKRKLQEAERKLRIAQQKEPEAQQSEPISILTDLDRKQIQRAIEVSSGVVNTIEKENGKLVDCIADIRTFLKRVEEALNRAAPKQDRSRPRIVVEPKHSFQPPQWKAVETNGKLGKCESAILGVLDRHGDSNIGRLSLLAGYTQSGSFKNALSALRMQGLIAGSNDQVMSITELGAQQGPFPQLPDTAKERFEYWKSFAHFGKCEKEILQVLFDADDPLHINEIANRACYEVPVSGSFKNSLSTLRTAGVLIGKNDEAMGLNPDLFT